MRERDCDTNRQPDRDRKKEPDRQTDKYNYFARLDIFHYADFLAFGQNDQRIYFLVS